MAHQGPDQDHSGHMADRLNSSRFLDVPKLKKRHLPKTLHWFLEEDVFSNEICGIEKSEIGTFMNIAEKTLDLFVKATDLYLRTNPFGIPAKLIDLIRHSWNNRAQNPYLVGRIDINGGFNRAPARTIEFNADTCSTLPETVQWQQLQLSKVPQYSSFNFLEKALVEKFEQIKKLCNNSNPIFLATSFGYIEDRLNCEVLLDAAYKAGFEVRYADLEDVGFADEGIFIDDEPVDVLYKLFPWDLIVEEEPELFEELKNYIFEKKVMVLNPPYAYLWQNKKFLAFISEHIPNDIIAGTFYQKPSTSTWVEKPIYGRIGENITVQNHVKKYTSTGDYALQEMIYQEYIPLAVDEEGYHYQVGIFLVDKPVALNIRCEEQPIITEEAEFMSHYII